MRAHSQYEALAGWPSRQGRHPVARRTHAIEPTMRCGARDEACGGAEKCGTGKEKHRLVVWSTLGRDPLPLEPVVNLERALTDYKSQEPTAANRKGHSNRDVRASLGLDKVCVRLRAAAHSSCSSQPPSPS